MRTYVVEEHLNIKITEPRSSFWLRAPLRRVTWVERSKHGSFASSYTDSSTSDTRWVTSYVSVGPGFIYSIECRTSPVALGTCIIYWQTEFLWNCGVYDFLVLWLFLLYKLWPARVGE